MRVFVRPEMRAKRLIADGTGAASRSSCGGTADIDGGIIIAPSNGSTARYPHPDLALGRGGAIRRVKSCAYRAAQGQVCTGMPKNNAGRVLNISRACRKKELVVVSRTLRRQCDAHRQQVFALNPADSLQTNKSLRMRPAQIKKQKAGGHFGSDSRREITPRGCLRAPLSLSVR